MNLKTVLDFMYSEGKNVQVRSFQGDGWMIIMASEGDSLRISCSDLDSGAETFLDFYFSLAGDASKVRWMEFQSKLRVPQ
jgi:hypothetical protein